MSFQSPFSGDFLCFGNIPRNTSVRSSNFQSPFSGDFLCFRECSTLMTLNRWIFQSPFSGDFLCFALFQSATLQLKNNTFNLHFQEIFFVSGMVNLSIESGALTFNLHFQEIFFVSVQFLFRLLVCLVAFNLHFQEIFFVSESHWDYTVHHPRLSISIFRRFSLFHRNVWLSTYTLYVSFNLHFQEIFFVSRACRYVEHVLEDLFQSPFSGDFLCFCMHNKGGKCELYRTFNLHFQEIFFVSILKGILNPWYFFFQSPFSGDFLCFSELINYPIDLRITFQSPFSGDFLCFWTTSPIVTNVAFFLSISIFRRFSLFPK